MIKVTTKSGTVYVIDEENKQIKRIPREGTTYDSLLRGFMNVGEWQEYRDFDKDELKIDGHLFVQYYNEQIWTRSTPIAEIDYGFKENENDK